MKKNLLLRSVLILLFVVLLLALLYAARTLLIPVAIASVLAMLFMPFAGWLERKGFNRIGASLVCALCFVIMLAGVITLMGWQVSNIASDMDDIKQNVVNGIAKVRQYVTDTFHISTAKQNNMLSSGGQGMEGVGKFISSFTGSLLTIVINLILITVYMIMLLYFRSQFKNFILMLVDRDEQEHAKKVIAECAKVAQKYLSGLFTIIGILWVMYGIGFTIVGVNNALFFAVLCGLCEIIPFVGNITGSSLTCIMALSQGGGIKMVLGVLITYTVVQSIQFYIIAPLIMNKEVKVNPLFTILVLFAGDLLWGIPGMILAIPLLGILKIIFDNVEELKPLGYLIGKEETKEEKETPLLKRIKKVIKRY